MTFELPHDVEQLRLRTHAFIRNRVIPHEPAPGDRLDESVRISLGEEAKKLGIFAPQVPVDFGGQGLALRYWSPIFQEAGYSPIGPAVLNLMAPDEGNMHMINLIGTDEQKAEFLAPLAAGTTRSCFGMTEPHPGAGSDPEALTASAVKDGNTWVLNGEKRFSSGAEIAGFAIYMARTVDIEGHPDGATMFLVPMDTPGVRVGHPIHTIDRTIAGGHPHLHFDNVRVPNSAVLGEVGLGFKYAQVRLGPARLTHCMRWLGLARRAQDIVLDRTNTREIFGSAIGELGIAQNMLAESAIDIETSDSIITKTAHLLESDPKAGSALSSIAKVHCSEAVYKVIDRAIQLCGGDGVSDGLPLAQYLSEVRPFRIYDGSNETHKWAISRRASSKRRRAVENGEEFRGNATTSQEIFA
ncbi:acyl-CoA dehydrogenase family protein [Paeniglutamicibacter sp.]|uniref:acyl-CoA dehydrogenase family protein n=1 Tax=Paeniglutamicibacter sp. TaxID=1934391 RepID=UPI00398957CB